MKASPLKQPTALLPIAMSLAALALVIGYVARFGVVRHDDEGTPARIFQLLLVAQLPLIAIFAFRRLPRAPRQALVVLGLQAAAALAAIGVVAYSRCRGPVPAIGYRTRALEVVLLRLPSPKPDADPGLSSCPSVNGVEGGHAGLVLDHESAGAGRSVGLAILSGPAV